MIGVRKSIERELVKSMNHLDAIETTEGKSSNWSYIKGEVNGLCIALRCMGGYEGVAFDSAWAAARPLNPPSRDEE